MYINEIQDIIYNDNTSNFTQEEKNRIIEWEKKEIIDKLNKI
jgi:hypothetical protein